MLVTRIHRPADLTVRRPLPLIAARVSAGFPSPADGYQEGRLDLNEHLIANRSSTFLIRAVGDSMRGAGILDGDLLVVDRSLQPRSGDIVIAVVAGEFLVKRLRIECDHVVLEAANDRYPPQRLDDPTAFEVWGVVTSAVHDYRR